MERRKVTTVRQLEMLIDFMDGHRDLALSRLKSKEFRITANRLWREVAELLNPFGPHRSGKEWAKIWNDLKCRVRTKFVANNKAQRATGGGPKIELDMTPLESRVANIMLGNDKVMQNQLPDSKENEEASLDNIEIEEQNQEQNHHTDKESNGYVSPVIVPTLQQQIQLRIQQRKEGMAQDKKSLAKLTPKAKRELLQTRDEKEVRSYLMPSASKIRKRNSSTVRFPCPLVPGTPTTPPRKQQPWEDDDNEAGPSGVTRAPGTYPSLRQTVEAPSSEAIVSDEIERELQDDLVGLCDSGSEEEDEHDIDEMDENQFTPSNLPRDASNYSAHDDELPENIVRQLNENDIRDSEVLREIGDGDMVNFDWSGDPNTFCGVKETFTGEAGPTFATEGLTPLEIFEKFFDDAMIEEIVTQTNAYAHKLLSARNLKPSSRLRKWKDCTKNDIWTFIAILMLQSLMPCPVEAEYWYSKSPLFKVSDFKSLMSHSRFVLIKKCLHFVDNEAISQVPNKKLAKIQPIINHLNNKFSSLYLPEQNISLDESLLLWKGKLSFSQQISNKAAQVGIKSYEVCESRTGYLWQMNVYSGKGDKDPNASQGNGNEPQNATSQIVLNLVRPLLNKGHVLVMDNYYNSPLLSRVLKKEKTDTMGTLRLNREFVPDSLKCKNKSNLQPSEVVYSHTKDLSIVVWRDSNIVSLISTFHKAAVSGKEKFGYYKHKPQVVLDYNLSMGGVDKKDQLLQAYPIERLRNRIWYKKLFRRLLNVSIHNSYVIASHSRNIVHRVFRKTLLENIVAKYCPRPVVENPKLSVTLGHYPCKNIITRRARCKVCSQINKIDTRTPWKCEACNVNLCIIGCFKYYHENMYTAPS